MAPAKALLLIAAPVQDWMGFFALVAWAFIPRNVQAQVLRRGGANALQLPLLRVGEREEREFRILARVCRPSVVPARMPRTHALLVLLFVANEGELGIRACLVATERRDQGHLPQRGRE